ncbi:hypothetical protein M569_12365 [Genlisea aurea]|uniref:DNA helicase n=1 Tax=Genlisea aurea TaxID=192259 RepID=S8C6L9_9LAMI|nr:hypothetical protein M569_12365 [Genlisea aurea]
MGALYLDTGFDLEHSWKTMLLLLDPVSSFSKLQHNPYRQLMELCQSHNWDMQFSSKKEDGKFTVEAKVSELMVSVSATNVSAKAAKRTASRQLYDLLKARGYQSKIKSLEQVLKKTVKEQPVLIGCDEKPYFDHDENAFLDERSCRVSESIPGLRSSPPGRRRFGSQKKQKLYRSKDSDDVSQRTDAVLSTPSKSRLYELCAANYWKPPVFECCNETGPSHFREFVFKVVVEMDDGKNEVIEAYGGARKRKKDAADNAAEGALRYLKSHGKEGPGPPSWFIANELHRSPFIATTHQSFQKMSGWDEGGVYYSDQAQFPQSDGVSSDQSEKVNRHRALVKFKEFIRKFQPKGQPNAVFPYREALLSNPKFLVVEFSDLVSYDPDQTLPECLRQNPADYLPLFETGAAEVLAGLRSKVTSEAGEMEEPTTGEVQILLRSNQDPVSIRSLGAEYISKLVKVSGIVIAASRTKAKATYVTLLCKNCRNVKLVPCRPGLGGAIIPRSCDHIPQASEEACPIDPYIVVPDKSKYVDQQTLKLQENPEDVPTGELPRNMLLSVDRHLAQTIVPGTRLTVMGIYSIFQAANSSTAHRGAVAVRQPYIRVVGLEETNETNSRGPTNFTRDEIEEFKKFASSSNAYDQICSKIAPSIFGHSDVKKALACLLFGGSRKVLPDGVKLRGDINVLLLGDPSTAKSQFLKFVEKTAPVAVYTSGKGSSAAGLTASVIRDNSSREFYLEGGAMVLADGGVVCIDEFDKMRAEDRVAIHEAMEQQTISIAKAGITTVLNSRTSVLAAANPPSGRYDDLKTAQDNIDLQTTILSRFDLIFIVKDIRMYAQDKDIASHIIKVHASADSATRSSKDDNWLKRYVQYCRSECHPRLSESAASALQEHYVLIRQDMRKLANESGESSAVPITVRQLEAIVRLSEALARMRLCHVANEDDVREAIRLFNNSTLDAARSGINEHANLSPEAAAEVKQAEAQIKRRVGIGSAVSERRLVDELARMGMNESIIRRALVIMHQREEVEYKRERRVIVRKA